MERTLRLTDKIYSKLDVGLRRSFSGSVVIADVITPTIDVDFLTHFHLSVDSNNRKLIDEASSLSAVGISCYRFHAPALNTV